MFASLAQWQSSGFVNRRRQFDFCQEAQKTLSKGPGRVRSLKINLDYWSKETGIPQTQFYTPVIRIRKTGSYKNKSKYGTITVVFDNKKLLDQIKKWSNDYLNKYAEVAQW